MRVVLKPKCIVPNDKVFSILGVVEERPGSGEAYAVVFDACLQLTGIEDLCIGGRAQRNLYSASTMANNITLN